MAVFWSRLTWVLLLLCAALAAQDTLCIILKLSCDYYRRLHHGGISRGIALIALAAVVAMSVQTVISLVQRRRKPLAFQLIVAALIVVVKVAGFFYDPFFCAFDSWR